MQPQPAPSSCHLRGSYPYPLPDPHCTPGALNPAVTQATIGKTICTAGYTARIRPPESITAPEKRWSMRAYAQRQSASHYEYDHLISLELGGASNDPRNLWPEPGVSPNLKDRVENSLHSQVCRGTTTLAQAQQIIATNWVSYYKQHLAPKQPVTPPTQPVTPPTQPVTPPTQPVTAPTPPDEGVVHPGAFCAPVGATGHTTAGTAMVCGPASDGRDRWHSA